MTWHWHRTIRSLLEDVKIKLTQTFKVKLLGPLRCFIGWEILRTPRDLRPPAQIPRIPGQIVEPVSFHPQTTPLPSSADLSAENDQDIPLDDVAHAQYL